MKRILASVLVLLLSASALAEVRPYSKVYEPQTSFVLASTVAWEADGMAEGERLPGTALVYLDEKLSVYGADGALIAETLSEYIDAAAQNVIPALYISDEATAAALKAWLEESGLGDVFVAADYKNAHLVRDVAQLLYVRGMVDFRSMEQVEDLNEIIRLTNSSFAKVALLPEELATEENVRYLQGRLLTVWAECESSMKALLGQYTGGVNGVLVKDYNAAIDALEFFADDAPSLLRVPNIVGHRGMPSVHVENTMESARAAYEAGADVIETDIYLSADGHLFVQHDKGLERLFNRADVENVETLTLAELQEIPFADDGEHGVQAANNTPAESAVGGKIEMIDGQRIPSLAELYDEFAGPTVIDTEIKSHNPEIVAELKQMVEEKEIFGDVFVITFNTEILDEMVKTWPEMSVGALGTQSSDRTVGQPVYMEYDKVIKKKGAEKALEMLYAQIDQWNATFNPAKAFSYELAVAGRHRGLTVWPWTYKEPDAFADAYLKGLYGLTTNFAWWASDFVKDVRAEDVSVEAGSMPPQPEAVDQLGRSVQPEGFELVVAEGSIDQPGEALCLWRLKQALTIQGLVYGDYYLYSNPFTVTVK